MTVVARSRTHEWTSPEEMAAWARSVPASEFFTAWARGEVMPPMAATLGFELASFEDGRVEIVCTPDEFQYNPIGTIHGGLAATLLDTATGCAVHSRLPAGTGYATLSLSVDFLRPITKETGTVRCVASVVSMGRRVAVAEGTLVDGSERMLARGSATCLLIEGTS